MARVILYMAMSLDGFITGPDDNQENPAGTGGMRLMEWLGPGPTVAEFRPSSSQSRIVFDESMATGAVITGQRTGDFAGYWGGDHHEDGRRVGARTAREPDVEAWPSDWRSATNTDYAEALASRTGAGPRRAGCRHRHAHVRVAGRGHRPHSHRPDHPAAGHVPRGPDERGDLPRLVDPSVA